MLYRRIYVFREEGFAGSFPVHLPCRVRRYMEGCLVIIKDFLILFIRKFGQQTLSKGKVVLFVMLRQERFLLGVTNTSNTIGRVWCDEGSWHSHP